MLNNNGAFCTGCKAPFMKRRHTKDKKKIIYEKSVCIVGTMRGNEVQQLYCCTQLVKKMKQLEAEGRITPGHKILIIPSCNPYSMNIQKRF